jgi:hypothetical protein
MKEKMPCGGSAAGGALRAVQEVIKNKKEINSPRIKKMIKFPYEQREKR